MEEDVVKQTMNQNIRINNVDYQTFISQPQNLKLARRMPELTKYKIIAEVAESKYCSAGIKVGQKYTFNTIPAMLLVNESTCPLCVRALGPIADVIIGFWDRIIEGVDPNQGMWYMAECLDPGIDRGGLGHVVFRLYARKTGQST